MAEKRVLVTGASSGIGREFAIQLAQQGYSVTAVARRESHLQSLLEELPGDSHEYRVVDLSLGDDLQSLLSLLTQQRFHLLINNAGYSVFEPFYSTELKQQQDILAVNCNAVLSLAHAFLQQSEKGDALINLASVVSYLPTPAQPMYSASKAFISALSECLWVEHKDRGVYVMGLCPGVTKTEFILNASGGESDGLTLPDIMLQSTDEVVGEALQALKKRNKAIVVTGWVNRLMMLMPRLFTRHRLLKMLAVIGDPERAL